MTLWTSLLVAVGTLLVIALLIVRPGRRLVARGPLSAIARRRLADRLPWWRHLDARRRARLVARVGDVRRTVSIIGANGLKLSSEQRLMIAAQLALASLGNNPVARRLPDEVVVYPEYAAELDPALPTDMLEDFGELASGANWQSQRLAVSWPDLADALNGGHHNPLLRTLATWQLARPEDDVIDDVWRGALDDAYVAQKSPHTDTTIDLTPQEDAPRFFGALSEAFFQRGPQLSRERPALYDLAAVYYDIDTAPRRPTGHRTPDSSSV